MNAFDDMKSSDTRLPVPPRPLFHFKDHKKEEMDVYSRFMRHLRDVPNSRMEIKILSAIQFTADMTGRSDAHVSKSLVEMGLRAPRMAFPADFLKYADQSLMRAGWQVGGPTAALLELKAYWDKIGEDKFAGLRGSHSFAIEKMCAF